MSQERPLVSSMTVGILGGFSAGLLLAAVLVAGRVDDRLVTPAEANPVAVNVSSTTAPLAPLPLRATTAAVPPPPEQIVRTVTETSVITQTEFVPAPSPLLPVLPAPAQPEVSSSSSSPVAPTP